LLWVRHLTIAEFQTLKGSLQTYPPTMKGIT